MKNRFFTKIKSIAYKLFITKLKQYIKKSTSEIKMNNTENTTDEPQLVL